MIDIVINESLAKHINEYDAIIIGTNCYQSMRHGFQCEISKMYPHIKEWNYKTKYGDPDKLGTILECKEKDSPLFILAFLTFGFNFKGNDTDYFNYEALEKCLKLINILYKGKHLASTMLGCSEFDGNADKNKVLDIINKHVTDFGLTIYDYKQESYNTLNQKNYFKKLKESKYGRKKTKLARQMQEKTVVKQKDT